MMADYAGNKTFISSCPEPSLTSGQCELDIMTSDIRILLHFSEMQFSSEKFTIFL